MKSPCSPRRAAFGVSRKISLRSPCDKFKRDRIPVFLTEKRPLIIAFLIHTDCSVLCTLTILPTFGLSCGLSPTSSSCGWRLQYFSPTASKLACEKVFSAGESYECNNATNLESASRLAAFLVGFFLFYESAIYHPV